MNIKKRYKFWRVFWVVLAITLFFGLLGVITLSLSPAVSKEVSLEKLLGWKAILSEVISVAFSTVFYYYTLNAFYRLFAERKKLVEFAKYIVIGVLFVGAYYAFNYYCVKGTLEISVSDGKVRDQMPAAVLVLAHVVGTIFYVGASLFISYLTYLRDERKQRKILEEQKM
ncbi:MAG TPA: hypothetical protein VF622_02045, partial [Segetibacter sp.]